MTVGGDVVEFTLLSELQKLFFFLFLLFLLFIIFCFQPFFFFFNNLDVSESRLRVPLTKTNKNKLTVKIKK